MFETIYIFVTDKKSLTCNRSLGIVDAVCKEKEWWNELLGFKDLQNEDFNFTQRISGNPIEIKFGETYQRKVAV